MDYFYVCASKFLIFNFVGTELAETDGGVADLLAWDQYIIFLKRFLIYGYGLCLRIGISDF
jgi:hypothetical protein